MLNEIKLTIRFPKELHDLLTYVAKSSGFTKTNYIRLKIHSILSEDDIKLDFSSNAPSERIRMVLPVNQLTYDILDNASKKYCQSINSVVVALVALSLKDKTK